MISNPINYRYIHTYIHACTHTCIHTCMYARHVCMNACIHTCMHSCIHASAGMCQTNWTAHPSPFPFALLRARLQALFIAADGLTLISSASDQHVHTDCMIQYMCRPHSTMHVLGSTTWSKIYALICVDYPLSHDDRCSKNSGRPALNEKSGRWVRSCDGEGDKEETRGDYTSHLHGCVEYYRTQKSTERKVLCVRRKEKI